MLSFTASRGKFVRTVAVVILASGAAYYFLTVFNLSHKLDFFNGITFNSGFRQRPHITTPITKPSSTSPGKANATLVMLVRNEEVNGAESSMQQMEDRFNRRYNYPWVFLNDVPFTEDFISRTQRLTNASVSYGLIPSSQWGPPEWIDPGRAQEGREKLSSQGVVHAGSLPYQNMCTFNSGFFYRHAFLQKYRYYWRVEPYVNYYCDLDYDPLRLMQDNEKIYGFTIALYEFEATISTLWDTVKNFTRHNPEYVHPDNAMRFLSDNNGESYNLCHFWSNFEIADMDFWRGEAYSAYFEHLYKSGGFYYERWGDAPVHSIAASLFLPRDKLHFFSDIGYQHTAYTHCPQGQEHSRGKCSCNKADNFDYDGYSCLSRYERMAVS